MPSTPSEEIHRRISSLQAAMIREGFEGALIIQRADLFYFSGSAHDAHLFVPAEGSPILLVQKNLEMAAEESTLDYVISAAEFSDLRSAIESAYGPLMYLGMELDVLPVNLYRRYEQLFAGTQIKDCSMIIRTVRMFCGYRLRHGKAHTI